MFLFYLVSTQNLQFYKKWRGLFLGIAVMMAFFIPWDIIFTNNKIWGFNDDYITGYKFLNLPIEEWLFFICIPYACLFTHYSINYFFPNLAFPKKTTSIINVTLLCILIITLWYNYDKWYTLINFIYVLILLGVANNYKPRLLQKFLPTYLVILIPFFLVNGTLTGSFTEEHVVWYNNDENLGIRLFTIPIEDLIYNLGMLFTVFVVMEYYYEKQTIKENN